jgi:hypothetical protein
MIVRPISGCKSRRSKCLYGSVARGAAQRSNPLGRSLPTMSTLGGLRKSAGRNTREPRRSAVSDPLLPEGGLRMPSHSVYGEGCHESSRYRTPHAPRNRQGSECLVWEVAGNGTIRSVGVSGMACREGWMSEAWETHYVSLTHDGKHASRRAMHDVGVGAAHSSHDAKDNITLAEQRGRTSAALLFVAEAGESSTRRHP